MRFQVSNEGGGGLRYYGLRAKKKFSSHQSRRYLLPLKKGKRGTGASKEAWSLELKHLLDSRKGNETAGDQGVLLVLEKKESRNDVQYQAGEESARIKRGEDRDL